MNDKRNKKLALSVTWLYKRGWTFKAAAKATGYSMQHIARVLRGERPGSKEFFEKLRALPKRKAVTAKYVPEIFNA